MKLLGALLIFASLVSAQVTPGRKTYRVNVIHHPPLVYVRGNIIEGYAVDLMRRIEALEGWSLDIVEVKDARSGIRNGSNGQWDGMVHELLQGEVDMILGPLSITEAKESVLDFSVPWYGSVGTRILLRKRRYEKNLWMFFDVLSGELWGAVAASLLIASAMLFVFSLFSPYSFRNAKEDADDPEAREFGLLESLWFCCSSLTPQGGGDPPKNVSGRLVAAVWWLFCFIIVASYTANLAAFLTSSRLSKGIQSVDDLGSQFDVKYAPVESSDAAAYFRDMAHVELKHYDKWRRLSQRNDAGRSEEDRVRFAIWQYPLQERFTQLWKYIQAQGLEPDITAAVKRVAASPSHRLGFAWLGDSVSVRYAAASDCAVEGVGPVLHSRPLAIAVRQGEDALRRTLSKHILQLRREGFFESLERRWWGAGNERILHCPAEDDESDGVSLSNMGGIFILVILGTVGALVVVGFQLQLGHSVAGRRASEAQAPPAPVKHVSLSQAYSNAKY